MDLVDFLINVKPELQLDQRLLLETEMHEVDGVVSAHFSPGHPHMLEVAYNPDIVDSNELLARVNRHGFESNKIGL